MSNQVSKPICIEQVNLSEEFLSKWNLLTKQYTCNQTKYTIYNADKNYLCDTDRVRRIYNTVISDPDTKKIYNVGSPMATPTNLFDSATEDICVTELIEGSMIYLFYDDRTSLWQMSTTNAVGGTYSYFRENSVNAGKSKTFLQMVLESFREPDVKSIDDLVFLPYFDKQYCYGFVMQHPQNEMVQRIREPRMFLVSVTEIISQEAHTTAIRYVSRKEYESWDCFRNIENGVIYFPIITEEKTTLEDYKSMFQDSQTESSTMGICITNTITGERTEVINPNYKEAKEIRGNNFNLQFHYLCLMKLDKVNMFLKHFPHYRPLFFKYKEQLNRFITNLHQTYFGYYISKSITGKIHKKYYYHISQIHRTIYLPSLEQQEKKVIKRSVVASYVESLEPGVILHMINFEKTHGSSSSSSSSSY